MAKVQPFRAFLYSEKTKSPIENLVSPPYDVINAEHHEKLRGLSQFNSVRLSLADDANDPARYKKMAASFFDWKERGILRQEQKPGYYLIEELFKSSGEERRRIGFIGLLEATSFAEKEVLPHEFTLAGPKKDRLELLKTMGAELSQIFFCYKDPSCLLESVYESLQGVAPKFSFTDTQGVKRRMWLVQDAQSIDEISRLLKAKKILIADGHHRYETAVKLREEEPAEKNKYVMGYFTNLDSPGFSILPIHRIFSLPQGFSFGRVLNAATEQFTIENFDKNFTLEALENWKRRSENIGLLMANQDLSVVKLLSVRPSNEDQAEVISFQKRILERILGWDVSALSKGVIQYEHETPGFKNTLKKTENGIGFFLPSTDLNTVMKKADVGERMPQKSTFFYPKLASGLVIYQLGSL